MKFWVSALKELWCQPLVTFGEKRKDSCYYVGQELKKSKTAEYFEAASSIFPLGESLCWSFGISLSQECTTFDLAVWCHLPCAGLVDSSPGWTACKSKASPWNMPTVPISRFSIHSPGSLCVTEDEKPSVRCCGHFSGQQISRFLYYLDF